MSKRAIITSFHSYSLNLIRMRPKAIISFDSHLDDYFGGSEKSHEVINHLSFPDRAMFQRVVVHTLLGLSPVLKGIPKYVVMPLGSFENRANTDGTKLKQLGVPLDNVIQTKKSFTEKLLGLKLFFCPPQSLNNLFCEVKKYSTIIDLDVDYCEEFQDSCYTLAPRVLREDGTKSRIGSLADVTRAISVIHPNTVVISEIILSHIKNPSKPFSVLLRFLKEKGYDIEYRCLVENDEVAETALRKHQAFVTDVMEKERDKLVLTKTEGKDEFFEEFMKSDKRQARLIRQFYKV